MVNLAFDSPEEIRKIDKSSMLSFPVEAANHYGQAFDIGEKVSWKNPKPDNIIIAGMGGSAIGGEIVRDWSAAVRRPQSKSAGTILCLTMLTKRASSLSQATQVILRKR
jgi:glucose-6-phosphate isomerase